MQEEQEGLLGEEESKELEVVELVQEQKKSKKKEKESHKHGHSHEHKHNKQQEKPSRFRCLSKKRGFQVVGIVTLLYCIAELAVAVATNSLTLLSDGFHNLSDVVALIIAYYATVATERANTNEMSYGWARTEILGALANAMFLLSLCFYVILDAFQRFLSPADLESGIPFLVIAALGLAVNTFGTIVFGVTGGGGHGHSHSHGHSHESAHSSHQSNHTDLNVRAVFIHYLGDMISSFLVLVAGFILKYASGTWVLYVDPVASLIIVALILYTTIPLVKSCIVILIQKAPTHLNFESLKGNIMKVEGVSGIHDLHVWELTNGMAMTSVHIICREQANDQKILTEVRTILHNHDLHSSAIQVEHLYEGVELPYCVQHCVKGCDEKWCCEKLKERTKKEKKAAQVELV